MAGRPNAKATFKIAATGEFSLVFQMKFTVADQDYSSAGTYDAITAGTGKYLLRRPRKLKRRNRFKVGDSVQVVPSTTNGIGVNCGYCGCN